MIYQILPSRADSAKFASDYLALIDVPVTFAVSPPIDHALPLMPPNSAPLVFDLKRGARKNSTLTPLFVKGLEFEAAFFIGIDWLAMRMPELYRRFVYVGITRAATYLGVTCYGDLPSGLNPVRSHFRTEGWR